MPRLFTRLPMAAVAGCLLAMASAAPGLASKKASHAGWPTINGMLLMNSRDQSRPFDGRPGMDPFDGTDETYSCDGTHYKSACVRAAGAPPFASPNLPCGLGKQTPSFKGIPAYMVRGLCERQTISTVPANLGHNELLGAHGNDTIYAGPAGDVIWGDHKPCCQPTTQVDRIFGGPGDDFIYASHGLNYIYTGGGQDVVRAHFGRGEIHCDSQAAVVYLSQRHHRRYHLFGCNRVSYETDKTLRQRAHDRCAQSADPGCVYDTLVSLLRSGR
jgi:RTX calcium-binding nonapeptide repeat (4 copies)